MNASGEKFSSLETAGWLGSTEGSPQTNASPTSQLLQVDRFSKISRFCPAIRAIVSLLMQEGKEKVGHASSGGFATLRPQPPPSRVCNDNATSEFHSPPSAISPLTLHVIEPFQPRLSGSFALPILDDT